MEVVLTQREKESNIKIGTKTFLALKKVTRRTFPFGKKVHNTEVVGKTRASDFLWARHNLKDIDFDQLIEAELHQI